MATFVLDVADIGCQQHLFDFWSVPERSLPRREQSRRFVETLLW